MKNRQLKAKWNTQMAKLSISKAAKEWGISRSTLQRRIKSGHVAVTQVDTGAGNQAKTVDTSEMLRVFGESKVQRGQPKTVSNVQVDTPPDTPQIEALQTEIKYLKRENELLREQLTKLQEMMPLMITHQPRRWWQRKRSD